MTPYARTPDHARSGDQTQGDPRSTTPTDSADAADPVSATSDRKVWGTSASSPEVPLHLENIPTDVEPAAPGGWGAPGHADLTGPIPRLRDTAPPEHVDESDPAESVTSDSTRDPSPREERPKKAARRRPSWRRASPEKAPDELPEGSTDQPSARQPAPEADTTWHLSDTRFGTRPGGTVNTPATGFVPGRLHSRPADPFVYGKSPRTREQSIVRPREARRRDEPDEVGAWSLTDLTFRVRSTRALAPIVYIAALVVLVALYITNIYATAMRAAATGNSDALLDLGITIVVGLAAVILGGALTRLVLEFFCNVADIAARFKD